jgi:hypothetical protein
VPATPPRQCAHYAVRAMPSNWIWMQAAIVFFVLVGMIIAVTKLV